MIKEYHLRRFNILNYKDRDPLPDMVLEIEERNKLLYEALEILTPKEKNIIKLRFGLNCEEHTLEEVGKQFDVSRERIRQIEAKALRKLNRTHSELKQLLN